MSEPRTRPIAPLLAGAVAVLIVGLLVVLVANRGGRGDSARTPLIDQPAPAVGGHYADGTPFELSRRKGSWVVLNFFTDDCVPCIAEHPELIEFVDQQRALGANGAEFYTIVQNSTREEVDRFFDTYGGGDWPVVYDTDYEFQIGFGVAQVPETWVIDPNGFVRFRTIATVTADGLSNVVAALQGAL